MMEVKIAVAKAPKFGFTESGDTVEMVERPRGGVTLIMADGQGHGRAAKRTSTFVATKAQALVADGARDGAVARAVHDYLYALRDGKVSAELVLVSIDMRTRTLVVSRNTHSPVFLRRGADGPVELLGEEVDPIGVHAMMKPAITEVPIEPNSVVLAFTDGILASGSRHGKKLSLDLVQGMVAAADPKDVATLADGLFDMAYALDERRPSDDMSVLAIGLVPPGPDEPIRRMSVTVPM